MSCYRGEFPSSQVPCLKPTAFALTFQMSLTPAYPLWPVLYYNDDINNFSFLIWNKYPLCCVANYFSWQVCLFAMLQNTSHYKYSPLLCFQNNFFCKQPLSAVLRNTFCNIPPLLCQPFFAVLQSILLPFNCLLPVVLCNTFPSKYSLLGYVAEYFP